MRVAEFKRLFGVYVPDRVSDAYLERVFNAFCSYSENAPTEQLTFVDLIEGLAAVSEQSAHSNAEWTMRLICGASQGGSTLSIQNQRESLEAIGEHSPQSQWQIHFAEFADFVKSVFHLVGKERRRRADSIYVRDSGPQLMGPSGKGVLLPGGGMGGSGAGKRLSFFSTTSLHQRCASPPVGGALDRHSEELIRKRAARVFKELDARGQGYLTLEDLESVFKAKEYTAAVICAPYPGWNSE